MKNILPKVILALFFVSCFDISTAASSSSSSSSAKRSSPEGTQPPEQAEKRQRTSGSQRPKRSLIIMRDEFVPGDRGKVQIREEINLLEQDHITKNSFLEHILQDKKINLPWIIALLAYEHTDGSRARDYADGRNWHRFLATNTTGRHPLYNGLLIGHPLYYAVCVEDNKLKTEYLGTEKDAQIPSNILIRSLLETDPTGTTYWDIGYGYEQKQDWDKAITYYELAIDKLKQEGNPYGALLVNLGNSFFRKRLWDKGIEFYLQANDRLRTEGKPNVLVLQDLGYGYYQIRDWDNAITFYLQATEQLQREKKPFGVALEILGKIYHHKRDWDNAISFYHQAAQQLQTEGKPFGQVLLNVCKLYSIKRDWDNAITFNHQAIEQLQREKEPFGTTLFMLAIAYKEKKNWGKSKEFFLQAIEQLQVEVEPLHNARLDLGNIYETKDKFEQATYYMKVAKKVFTYGIINLLCLCASQPLYYETITQAQRSEYAQRLLRLSPDDRDMIQYKKDYPEHFALAHKTAIRFTSETQELQHDAQTSPSRQQHY